MKKQVGCIKPREDYLLKKNIRVQVIVKNKPIENEYFFFNSAIIHHLNKEGKTLF